MQRREFIKVIAGSATAWPLAARAQHTPRRIGVLMPYAEHDPEAQGRAKVLEEGLQNLGWTKNALRIDYRWAGGDSERFQLLAAELVNLKEDAIVAVSTPAVKTLQRLTQNIPIVFTQVSDPVSQGIVTNMARPARNVSGFTNYDPEIGGKWLGLLKEAIPSLLSATIIFNPETAPYTALYLRAMEAVAPSIAVKVTTSPVHTDAEIEEVFTKQSREQGSGLILPPDIFLSDRRKRFIELAARFALPAMYPFRYFVVDGGLMSYGIDHTEQTRAAAGYIDRILKGENVGDLPVQTPTRFQLIVNLKTAKPFNVPAALLTRTDEVIE
jgi:putative tryptophan/tyrosine transport system substrate-binding protein